MAEEIVRIIKVDTKNSGKSIKDLRNEIKTLRTELEKTEVGSEEFSAALKRLTQTQKEYNSVQEQVRDMSRTNQQDMVRFATFAQNLGKSYSALNAAVGLFADKNEDVQKAMLRVQRTIQLVQGMEGIAGLVRDIPKVLAGFRNWLTALDPVEKQVNNIVKGINGVDPSKLKDITEANRLAAEAAKAPTTTATVGGGTRQFIPTNNEELNKATTTYYPTLLQQERDLLKVRKELESQLKSYNQDINEYSRLVTDLSKSIVQGAQKAGVPMQSLIDLFNTHKDDIPQLLVKIKEIPGVFEEASKEFVKYNHHIDTDVQAMSNRFADAKLKSETAKAEIEKVNSELELIQKQIAEQEVGMTKFQKTLARTGVVGRTAFTMIKTALASIGIGLLIAGVVKLVSYLGQVVTKTQEWVRINKEIATSTNQIASKSIVVLKELSIAYGKVGDSADAKKEFIEKYNDKIKETGIAIDDVKKAEDVFVNNTDKYVAAITARAKAQATEQQAIKLYQEYLDKRYELENQIKWWQQGLTNMAVPEAREAVAEDFIEKNRQKNQEAIDKLDKDIEEKLKRLFETVAEFDKEYSGVFASIKVEPPKDDSKYKEWLEQKKKDLETLKKANDEALQVFMDDRTKELQAVAKHYDELIALAKKYEQDTTLLEAARQREIQEIVDKYNKQALDEEQRRINEQISLIEEEISKIQLNERLKNAKLKEPREEDYQKNWFVFGAYAATSQTFPQIEAQKQAEINYNNEVLANFKERIEAENAELKKQLEIVGITGEEKLAIETKIAENEKELSNAVRDTEIANVNAKIKAQLKYQAAVQAAVQVAGSLTGAIANMYKVQAQDEKKSAKEREEYAAKYKGWAKAQAIIDTFAAANAAFRAMADIPPAPAWGIAAAAAAIIAGMANVRAIEQESVVSSMSSSVSGSSVSAPAPLSTAPIEYTRNLVGDKELDEINQPIKCYVLEQDVTRVQNKVKVTETNATF